MVTQRIATMQLSQRPSGPANTVPPDPEPTPDPGPGPVPQPPAPPEPIPTPPPEPDPPPPPQLSRRPPMGSVVHRSHGYPAQRESRQRGDHRSEPEEVAELLKQL